MRFQKEIYGSANDDAHQTPPPADVKSGTDETAELADPLTVRRSPRKLTKQMMPFEKHVLKHAPGASPPAASPQPAPSPTPPDSSTGSAALGVTTRRRSTEGPKVVLTKEQAKELMLLE